MGRRVFVLLGALVCAGLAAYLALNFIGNRNNNPSDPQIVEVNKNPTKEVLVASKDIKMGEKLGGGAVGWVNWPEANLQPTMITKDAKPDALEQYEKARARLTIYQGEVLVEKKVVLPGDSGFLAAMLPKGMRAISVAISERSSAGGFILPNDRVDVILTKKTSVDGGNTLVISDTVLTNVRVLAVNQNFRQEQEGDTISVPEGKTATLELDARQAEVIAQVESSGELSLALRSIAESDGIPIEKNNPVLTDKYAGSGKAGTSSDTLFVRYGIETYAQNR